MINFGILLDSLGYVTAVYSIGKVSEEVGVCIISSKQLTICSTLWREVVFHQFTVLGAGLQATLLNAIRIDVRRKGSLTDSTLQLIQESQHHIRAAYTAYYTDEVQAMCRNHCKLCWVQR